MSKNVLHPPRARGRAASLCGRRFLAGLLLLGLLSGHSAGEEPAEPEVQVERLSELIRNGNIARRKGRTNEAITAYREARRIAPEQYEVRILLADTLRRAGRPEAMAEYEAAMRLAAARPEAYIGQALMRRSVFDYAGAVAIVERGLKNAEADARADLIAHLGEVRRREGRLETAFGLFTKALASKSAAMKAHAGLARVAEDRGDLDGALRHWASYLASRREDTAAVLRRQELKELRAAIAALRAAVERAPGTGVRAELGRLLMVSGAMVEAAGVYRDVLKTDPRHWEALRGLALALRAAGDSRGAAAAFRDLLEVRPGDATALYHMVALGREAGDLDAEESAWLDLLEARPADGFAARAFAGFVERTGEDALRRAMARLEDVEAGPVSRQRALLLALAKRWPETATVLYTALRHDPSDPRTIEVATEILYRRPALLQSIARMARAETEKMGETGDGGSSMTLAMMSRLNALAGRRQEALTLAQRAVAADPGSAAARSLLAESYMTTAHNPERAIEEMTRAIAIDPARLVGHVDLALVYLKAGRPGEAEAAARRGLDQIPDSAGLLSILGAALADQGELEEAARAYRAALTLDPADNFRLSRSQYPLILAALGRHVEARRALVGDLPLFPAALYQEAWAFVRDASRDRTYNGQDWQTWRDRHRGRLTTPLEAYAAIATMLAALDDPYTRLRGPEETAAMYLSRHGERVAVDPLGRNRPHSRTVATRELDGGVGYIQLSNLTDPNVIAAVRRALEEMRDKEGLVLDLRGNTGGLARAADAIGDMLIGPGRDAGVDVGPEGATPRVTGGDGQVTDSPLVVLVDGQTGSAAERLARALAAAGRGTLVGETTYGKGLYQNSRVLPGGMTVLVSAGEMLDPGGRPIQDRGLRPKRELQRPREDPEPGAAAPPPARPGVD